jgi:hypothetical protein
LDYTEHVVRQAAERYDGELKIRQLVGAKDKFVLIKRNKTSSTLTLTKQCTEATINICILQIKNVNHFSFNFRTEIDALQIEKQHLQRAWNDTISVVRSRDDALNAAREALV